MLVRTVTREFTRSVIHKPLAWKLFSSLSLSEYPVFRLQPRHSCNMYPHLVALNDR